MVTSEARNSGVRLTDLTKSYGDVKAVRGVNISIRPGVERGARENRGARVPTRHREGLVTAL
jgi:hypothetical protein